MRKFIAITLISSFALGGCVTDRVRFQAGAGQTVMLRDGVPAVSSTKKETIALLRRAGREIPQGSRVGYVLAVNNRTGRPIDLTVSGIRAVQTFEGKPSQGIAVLTFEQLQREEKNRQIAAAIIVGLAAVANAAAAANSGYYNNRTTISTPRGTYIANTTGYSPGLAAIASANAANQNAQMIDATIAQGQANMATLEREYLKDHTLLPGEWHGGLIGIEPPISDGSSTPKTYEIQVTVGGDTHVFNMIQEPTKQ